MAEAGILVSIGAEHICIYAHFPIMGSIFHIKKKGWINGQMAESARELLDHSAVHAVSLY